MTKQTTGAFERHDIVSVSGAARQRAGAVAVPESLDATGIAYARYIPEGNLEWANLQTRPKVLSIKRQSERWQAILLITTEWPGRRQDVP